MSVEDLKVLNARTSVQDSPQAFTQRQENWSRFRLEPGLKAGLGFHFLCRWRIDSVCRALTTDRDLCCHRHVFLVLDEG